MRPMSELAGVRVIPGSSSATISASVISRMGFPANAMRNRSWFSQWDLSPERRVTAVTYVNLREPVSRKMASQNASLHLGTMSSRKNFQESRPDRFLLSSSSSILERTLKPRCQLLQLTTQILEGPL